MRAVSIDRPGPASALKLQEVAKPRAGAGEVLVKVHAAGVNFADVAMRLGMVPNPLPFVPGVEGAGVVEVLGEGVSGVAAGDRVAWAPVLGGGAMVGSYAEYQAVSAAALLPVPDAVSLEMAAAVTLQGLTAHYLVHDKKPIETGTRVLLHAAAGGMGLLLCRWLTRLGAEIIGTVSTEEKAAAAREAGADHTILYRDEDFAARTLELTGGEGVDYVIDGVGQTTFVKNFECVAPQGHICLYGMASGPPDPISPLVLLPKALCVSGGMMTNFLRTREEVLRKGAEIFAGVEEGWLALPRVRVFALEEAAQAHEWLEGRGSIGKLVLNVGGGGE